MRLTSVLLTALLLVNTGVLAKEKEVENLQRRLYLIKSSKSWTITEPLRMMAKSIKKQG